MAIIWPILVCSVSFLAGWCFAAQATIAQDFDRDIAPILRSNCITCHNQQNRSAGVALHELREILGHPSLVRPGDPEHSRLLEVLAKSATPRMPLGKPPLDSEQVETIAKWIRGLKAGTAPAARWWAFEKVVKPEFPNTKSSSWPANEVDRFVFAALDAKGLTPSNPARENTLRRRLYFDLLGIPPPADEPALPYEALVDKLLADRRFGERWGQHWLDVARYADTQGFEADKENYHIWRYRDYVIAAFNNDKPYDRFILEQLAGDELTPATAESRIATGFLRLAPRFQTTNAQELRQMTLDELTATTASAFLGLTLKCAQCHDHRYDPIPQRDFYRMQAFFAPIQMTAVPAPFSDPADARRMSTAREDAAARLRTAEEQFLSYQKDLIAKLKARGGTLPEEAPQDDTVLRVTGEDGFVRVRSHQVVELERHIWRAIANALVPNEEDKLFTLSEKQTYLRLLGFVDGNMGGRDLGTIQREVRRYQPTAEAVRNSANDPNLPAVPVTFVRLRGEFNQLGEWVQPGFPSALTGHSEAATLPADQFGNPRAWRTPLAKWIASPDNPLTSRVMVNRVWMHLFGEPIVATPGNFGRNGAAPANQALLDWLAVSFVENKWSVKSLVRKIVLSSTYRQTSIRVAPKESAIDPENHLLWRQNRKRLEGEAVRDAILSVSGELTDAPGGPGVFPRLPSTVDGQLTIKNLPSWTPSDGPESRKRSVYVFKRRQREFPLLATMDAPALQTSCDRRTVSTTALQALMLMNGEFIDAQVRAFAVRVRREAASDLDSQIGRAYHLAFGRLPAVEELKQLKIYLDSSPASGLEGLCRILMNANEFVYVD